MSLKVIGTGFGRTGTLSLKLALEQLGLGPCHHMTEVMTNPAQLPLWKAISDGIDPDWQEVFAGYTAQVDFPGAAVWRHVAVAFPEAKVIHTERPEDEWYASFSRTIGKFFAIYRSMELPPPIRAIFETMDELIYQQVFGGTTDRDALIAAYRKNNAMVREVIPADRLLVFNVKDGWAPLCGFLGVPVPDAPFPRTNERAGFWSLFGGEPEMSGHAEALA